MAGVNNRQAALERLDALYNKCCERVISRDPSKPTPIQPMPRAKPLPLTCWPFERWCIRHH